MDGLERFFYNLYVVLMMVPLAVLRFLPFRRQLRISSWIFWGVYALMLAVELVVFNLYAWPQLLTLEMLQHIYTSFLLFFFFWFLICIRCFWQQLFIYFVMAVYGLGLFSLHSWVYELIGDAIPLYILRCAVLCLGYLLTWNWMRRLFLEGFQPFYEYATKRFWHTAWLLPLSFCVVEAILTFQYTHGDTQSPGVVFCRYLACIGLWAGLVSMRRLIHCLQDNRILEQNACAVRKLYEERRVRCQLLSDEFRQARRLRHDLRHFSIELEHYLEDENWEGFQQALKRYQERLDAKLESCQEENELD